MLTAIAVGAGIGALGSLASTGLSFGLNQYSSKKAAKKAYQYWRLSQLQGPSLQRQGLEKAGYNPLLALNQGAASFNQGVSAPTTSAGDFVGSAKQGGELAKEAVKAAKASIDNVEADTALKRGQLDAVNAQKNQTDANTSLLESQTERSDLAYGRDIVGTIADVAGTAGSLYSAKALSDVAKSNAEVNARNATVNERRLNQHTTQVMRDKKGNRVGSRETMTTSRGVPSVQSTPKTKPNMGGAGHSAKSTGSTIRNIAKEIASELIFLGPLAGAAWGAYEGFNSSDKSTYKRMEKAKEKSYWSNLRLR